MEQQGGASKRKRSSIHSPSSGTSSRSPVKELAPPPSPRPGYTPPGRLGAPRMELYQDARLHPRLREVLAQQGLDRYHVPTSLATLSPSSTLDELQASMTAAEQEWENLHEALPNSLPSDSLELEVETRNETITGLDANLVTLKIYRPVLRGGPLPCIVYVHGGGIPVMQRETKVHRRWCTSLAAMGMVVVSVDHPRSRRGLTGFQPHPAALNDVCAAVHYVHSHRDDLNTINIVLHGEGGGGRLVLAAALRAKREGWLNKIDGVYACSPFISNAYNWSEARKLQELPSLVECHGYMLNVDHMAYMAHLYTPNSADATNPLAWPYHASREDLEGLPPHVLALDELDPLRSEGEGYVRKLAAAGVLAVGEVNIGSVHAASVVFRQAVPEMHRNAVRSVAAFARQA
ncbi:hypothetical protein BAUCODRAFT_66791 [Baudoinia panamericana UAMH 10762]|uniref:Alpha/beta hydrolase fold-3 domain-containing protein n=1 Tax=Baudoinia panamericana (strain UAMH 10762) TaxID=717646 RepID=M2NFT5_BAUPA|nr:uncharacterized protein BAUCODRAFT_66791 [Baudoinia panamericana UAMH 10762]EMC98124.1 hypothetical protein BAUCODRAFT_66791 [Baudoinia panamericana UAMH 10762]